MTADARDPGPAPGSTPPPPPAPAAAPAAPHWLAGLLKPAALAAASSIAGVVAYVSTPLNEWVNSMVWTESAELLLISQLPELPQGQVLHLDVFLRALSPAPVTEGVLTLRYPAALLRPGPEAAAQLTMKTPRTGGTERLTPKPLEFIADAAGEGELTATLQTKNALFTQNLKIRVLPPQQQRYPTRKDFSGRWNIDLGGIHGFMEIKDSARSLTGEYHLGDGTGGQIEGTRDGKTFRANFYRGAAPSRLSVDGTFDPAPGTDLEVRGKATVLVPTGQEATPWRSTRVMEFNAIASAR